VELVVVVPRSELAFRSMSYSKDRGGFVVGTTLICSVIRNMASLMSRWPRPLSTSFLVKSQLQRCNPPRRPIASTAASGDAANLPLGGIKVLDMTRVLAGVSEAY
jgi:hypothetical protein